MLNIFWFRKDLRISDNRALHEFIKGPKNSGLLFLYIKNENTFRYFGRKRIDFLDECLNELSDALDEHGFKLNIVKGSSTDVFTKIVKEYGEVNVFANSQVEPYCIRRDEDVRKILQDGGGNLNLFTDTTLFEPGEVRNGIGEQYKVFTPFSNRALEIMTKEHFRKYDCRLSDPGNKHETMLTGFEIYDHKKSIKEGRGNLLKGGRKEGIRLLKRFYEKGIDDYKTKRDFPSVAGTSFLSAHLHFGTVGIREVFRTALARIDKTDSVNAIESCRTWIKELLWREFYYNITYHNPRILSESFRKKFDNLKWSYDEGNFEKWCKGETGFPIVDAGMRQLRLDGWMHNRLRMITAMFLTKDLFIDWRLGEKYFAEHLTDLDVSSNNGGWQWSASTGVDSQPYFRVFNPYLQSKKFDRNGEYIRKFVNELRNVPDEFIHEPHLMNEGQQKEYGVRIGKDYPAPMVDHSAAREMVIKNFKETDQRYRDQ